MIELKKVTKKFDAGKTVLTAVDQVDLSISAGEVFGIIGYSGAGKSTLIRLLNGLEKPTSGTVEINEQTITAIKGGELRKARQKVSMIFQHFNLLWSRTVKENIEFPLEIAGVAKAQRGKRVQELIELVGLTDRENAYPSELSGGQKQRVGIARALANDPEVLLCDEATSALDPETTDAILDLLVDINKRLGLTIVLITHEMHVIRKICHRVAVMEGGRVVEMGDVLNVFQSPKEKITKRFVAQVTDTGDSQETIKNLRELYPTGELVKLVFVGDQTEQPILTKLIRSHSTEVNIVQGNISHTQRGAYGTLILQLKGSPAEIEEALTFLRSEDIQAEVIHND
ncbi:methionine import ABC transporter ATP-binding protein MetN [Planococcus antarcticus DSM 14505]|uniref:Methionine ABC transporter ATP-binding protein n=1 Tax=Planococcus antarcticus DSM 14505 TaxID=1185653 RepID=A0A1C7DJ17_9BACL|nr:methionine ABC transporter ATP-binding protein [Planococcus antarcticus]ANU11560.1 methionine ABC transporter ATP-binding protein [Planococcus antarcticus DSM 14505]EIM08138.1 methionine import ABC transporter ATP-binding protein MetN [Planococcus antarcticus DSM 14505]